ncbi:MAG TPA: MATE family efflux transporter [Firmicutes bacterium]|nr:MATE family efflux transporter [Bacillota bacterium]
MQEEGRQAPGTVRRAVWQLAWPVVAEQALGTVTQVVDMAMMGRLSTAAVTAVGLSIQPFWFVSSLFMGLAVGATVLVARSVGGGDRDTAARVTGQTLVVASLLGVAVAATGYLWARQVVVSMGGKGEVIPLGAAYIRAIMPGMPPFFLLTVVAGCLRGAGDTRTPMYVNAGLNVLHIFLNWVLIYGNLGAPALGVVGAGLSTSISRGLGTAALLVLLFSGRSGLRVPARYVGSLDGALVGRVVRVGMPAALERVFTSGGQLAYARQVASLGMVPYAAHSLSLNAESFSYMPGIAFATAATALVGQHLGAGRTAEAERSTSVSLQFALATMGFMAVLFFAIPGYFLRIYTGDAQVIRLGIPLLRIVAFTQFPEAVGFVLPGALRGAGDTAVVMYITVIGMWGVRLGLTSLFVFGLGMGLVGAWLAMLADWLVRAGLYIWRFRQGRWKRIRV